MTRIEIQFYETIIRYLPLILKELIKLNEKLESGKEKWKNILMIL